MLSLGTGATTTSTTTQQWQILPIRVIYQSTILSASTKIAGT
jgi:hypothetical protein